MLWLLSKRMSLVGNSRRYGCGRLRIVYESFLESQPSPVCFRSDVKVTESDDASSTSHLVARGFSALSGAGGFTVVARDKEGLSMRSAKDRMPINAAIREVFSSCGGASLLNNLNVSRPPVTCRMCSFS